ncbi:unnamed protein product [Cyprideis torosa]|uniref:Uncharacterized protein n=1 Tax=Cyprideis torosa TaxID=163714 RepID=A0A7R8WSB8_9CRUS|nr:unnamed protein product [Cyprideis torosa]CAG0904976.1 unnamed protein product [Cyprideis torosa]
MERQFVSGEEKRGAESNPRPPSREGTLNVDVDPQPILLTYMIVSLPAISFLQWSGFSFFALEREPLEIGFPGSTRIVDLARTSGRLCKEKCIPNDCSHLISLPNGKKDFVKPHETTLVLEDKNCYPPASYSKHLRKVQVQENPLRYCPADPLVPSLMELAGSCLLHHKIELEPSQNVLPLELFEYISRFFYCYCGRWKSGVEAAIRFAEFRKLTPNCLRSSSATFDQAAAGGSLAKFEGIACSEPCADKARKSVFSF